MEAEIGNFGVKKDPPDGWLLAARRLILAVQWRQQQWRPAQPAAWAKTLRAGCNAAGVQLPQFEALVDWYSQAAGQLDCRLPKPSDARGFVRLLPQLLAMQRADAAPEPTSQDRDLARRLACMGWPAGLDSELPAAVAEARQTWGKLRDGLRRIAASRSDRLGAAADHLAHGLQSSPAEFAAGWLEQWHDKFSRRLRPPVSLGPFSPRLGLPEFDAILKGALAAWAGDAALWPALRRALVRQGVPVRGGA